MVQTAFKNQGSTENSEAIESRRVLQPTLQRRIGTDVPKKAKEPMFQKKTHNPTLQRRFRNRCFEEGPTIKEGTENDGPKKVQRRSRD